VGTAGAPAFRAADEAAADPLGFGVEAPVAEAPVAGDDVALAVDDAGLLASG
jgi:hypothetical protein